MSAEIKTHLDYLLGEWRAAQAAPLSRRKAMLVVGLIDAMVDRLARAGHHDDILVFRSRVDADYPQLATVMLLASLQPGGPGLAVAAMTVAVPNLRQLTVEDFMVSLYNDHSVQRLMIVTHDKAPVLAHPVLTKAVTAIQDLVNKQRLQPVSLDPDN